MEANVIMKRISAIGAAGAAALMLATGSPAAAQTAIGPNQHFIGLVNGSNDNPTVETVCPGPSSRRGHVAPQQMMSVAEVADGAGGTGSFSQIYAWFVPPHATTNRRPTTVTFTTYGPQQKIPTSIRVPCSGTRKVQFSPCPYLAPCAAGFSSDIVRVHFATIAN